MLTFRAGQMAYVDLKGSGLRHFSADMHLALWLDKMGIVWDAITDHDLERLAQVVALKFIGIPLRRIGRLAPTKTTDLAVALQAQRQALEEKRRLLDQAIGAIHEAEAALRREGQAAPALYRRIIEVIEMQSNNDWNAKYEELVNAKMARLKALTPEEHGLVVDVDQSVDAIVQTYVDRHPTKAVE